MRLLSQTRQLTKALKDLNDMEASWQPGQIVSNEEAGRYKQLKENIEEAGFKLLRFYDEDLGNDYYVLALPGNRDNLIDSEPGGDNSESWYEYKNEQEEGRQCIHT